MCRASNYEKIKRLYRYYGEDRLVNHQNREVKGFCIQKNDQEKIIKFILENGEHIKEIVTIERSNGQVFMKRPNGISLQLFKTMSD